MIRAPAVACAATDARPVGSVVSTVTEKVCAVPVLFAASFGVTVKLIEAPFVSPELAVSVALL